MLLHLVLHGDKAVTLENCLVNDRDGGLLHLSLVALQLILQKLLYILLVRGRSLLNEVVKRTS